MFNFINNNIINLIDNKGEVNINNFKKIFTLITKLNFDIFDYYYSNSLKNENNKIDTNTFDFYLNSQIINLDNEDPNILYYLNDKQNKVDIGINNNATLNNKNNKTIKKLLTTNYNYGFNETNDYFDVVSLCLFIFDYYYNLNDGTLQNYLKIKNNNQYSKTQQYIYKKPNQYLNHTLNNINNPNLNLNNNNGYVTIDKSDSNININQQNDSKIMLVSVLSGHNIIKPYSDFTSRPNCYFVLEFDDKNYTSDIVMNSSQPNFNEELEIKINAEDYTQKLNALLIYITVFSFVDENGSIFIGRCEISPSKMFPFLNDNLECEDFFHIIGEEGQVMGQLNIKFKFDPEVLGNLTRRKIIGSNNSLLMSNLNMSNEKNLNNKKNNTISFPLNKVVENNNKNKFIMTGGFNENDPLHKKLAEAMNSIDDLTQILKNKVENEEKEKKEINMKMNINNNINNNMNKDINYNLDINNDYNKDINYNLDINKDYNKDINYNLDINKNNNNIINQNVNLSDIKSEDNLITNSNELLDKNNYYDRNNTKEDQKQNNINYLNNNEENFDYGEEEEMNYEMEDNNQEMDNNQFEDNLDNNENEKNESNFNNNLNINNNNLNEIEYDKNKLTMTDFNNLNNSQKLSINDEENGKASFYSDNKGNNDKNNKMKYLKNYDKKILNKIQKIMKNQK